MSRTLVPVAALLSASSLLLLDSTVKSTALLLLAAIAAIFLRRDSAATRHFVWLLAIFAMLLVMAARWILWNILRQGTVIKSSQQPAKATCDPLLTALEAACLQLGTNRPVTLFIHPDKTIPVVWGILRCRLLLPAAARHWSDEQLQSVLLHELAHIKRCDMTAQLLAQIACALHWFNPLVWLAAWRLGVERERACDDLVLAGGVRPSAYAGHLLRVVTGLSPARWTHPCGLAMARKSTIEGRLVGVLSKNLNRRGVSVALAAITLAIGVGIAVPVAMLRAVDETAAAATVVANGDDAPPQVQVPRDSTAAFLLSQWQELEGRQTPLSETSLARLRVAIDKWVKQPSAGTAVARVNALRNWNLERAEHPAAEVAVWLDEIAAIHPGPLAFAIRSDTLVGPALSAQRQAALKFGPATENGLRAAWSRYPARDTYLLGDVISTSLVIQNVSQRTVEFECPHSLENIVTWEAKTDDGRTIATRLAPYTGTFPLYTWQLEPGAVAEIYGRGVVIGESDRRESVNSPSVLTVLQVKPGEQVTVHWKLREPVAMTTGEIAFKVVSIEDVPVWSTAQAGKWPLAGGVTLEVKQDLVHATDIASTAILTWPTDKTGSTPRHVIWLAGDAFANRDPWLLAWERGTSILWTMSGQMQSSQDFHKVMPTPQFLRRIDFSDRENITESTWSYVPDIVPDAIRAQFIRAFLPLATTPRTPAYEKPSLRTSRAEDVRPVTELLNGAWKSRKGYMDVRITFPEKATDVVKWTMDFQRKQGSAPISETLTRIDSPNENAVHLVKPRRQPRAPGTATLGRLKRGIGETLLLDIMPHVDFPEYERATGIVLVRADVKETRLEIGDITNVAEPLREALRPALEGGGNAGAQPAATRAPATAKPLPQTRHLFNDKYSAIAVQSKEDVNFVLAYAGFLSSGMSEWSSGTDAETKWRFEGLVHLVDVEKTRAVGKNVDKRAIAVKYTSDAPRTLFLDGKAYDLSRPARVTSMGAVESPGRLFILRENGEPLQTNRTLPLRNEKDLVTIGDFAVRDRFHMETYAESRRVQAMEGWVLGWDVQHPIQHSDGQRAALLRIFPDGRLLYLNNGRQLQELKLPPAEVNDLLRWLTEEQMVGEQKLDPVEGNDVVQPERGRTINMWNQSTDFLVFVRNGRRRGIVESSGASSSAFAPIRQRLMEMVNRAEPAEQAGAAPRPEGVKAGSSLKSGPLPNAGGQTTVSGETQDQWIVEGTVTDADGKPLADVPVQAHTEYAPAKEIGRTSTNKSGHYRLTFRLDFDTLTRFRGVSVRPVKEGFIDKDVAKSGKFSALLYPGEKPRRPGDENAPYVGPETFAPGEMRRFADRDLVLTQPGRADFVLMPAGEITGQIVDEDGKGIYGCGIAVAVEGQRKFDCVAMTGADENGRFRLTGVPFHKPLLFTASPTGHVAENSQSLPEKFAPSLKHEIRIVIPKTARGFGRPKIEQTNSPDGGDPGAG